MSKFKRICSLLCSGMCILGTNASANPGKETDPVGKNLNLSKSLNKIDVSKNSMSGMKNDPQADSKSSKNIKLGYGLDDFVNSQKKESEENKKKYWPVGFEAFFGSGARINGRTRYAHAVGALEVLNNPKFIESLANLDSESIEKAAKSKQISSNLLYAARWIVPILVAGVSGNYLVRIICSAMFKSDINKFTEKLEELGLTEEFEQSKSSIDSSKAPKGADLTLYAFSEYMNQILKKSNEKISDEENKILNFFDEMFGKVNTGLRFCKAACLAAFCEALVFGVLGSVPNYFSQTHQGQSDMLRKMSERIREIKGGKVVAVEANQANNKKNMSENGNMNRKGKKKSNHKNRKKINKSMSNLENSGKNPAVN